jgi:glyceraldehyde-3-phosphate dehydrogenase (NADP+)
MAEDMFAPLMQGGTPPVYNYFDGSVWKASSSGETVEVKSPVDGSIVGKLQVNTTEEINAAIDVSKKAQPKWEATPLNERVKIMHLAADWIRHYQEQLSNMLVMEIGKTAKDAASEIKRTAELTDYFADEVLSLRGETLDSDNFPGYDKGRIAIIERVAYGVTVAIGPFNYPVNLSGSKLAPALLMGNSVVFKPPTMGGITALFMAQLFLKAGLPPGVLTCVTGLGNKIGDYLVSHPEVRLVAFTGSSATGNAIAHKTNMIPLVFECGGNNPAVVLPDADMKITADEIVKGAFSYSGQRCTAIKYVLATQDVLEKTIPAVQAKMAELLKMGDPRDAGTKMIGPVISEQAAIDIENAISEAVAGGAELLQGGKRTGTYIEPTLLRNVHPDMRVVKTEIFGPIISFIAVPDYDEAIKIINRSTYGLQACVFTADEGKGLVMARKINVGTVQINGSPQRGPDHFPFLGVKGSGVNVQGVKYSLEAMSRFRPIVVNKPE